MFKKKPPTEQPKPNKPTPTLRVDTEANIVSHKEPRTKVSLGQRCEYSEAPSPRLRLSCQELQQVFQVVKDILEEELDLLLLGEATEQGYDELQTIQFFRVRDKTKQQYIEDLGKAIQACELLYSKLRNNEKITKAFYVKDEEELLLFFKHLFGKPYTLCNLPSFRKVLNTIWQHQIFSSFHPRGMAGHLRLWAAGLEFPLNPAAIPLHRLVFSSPDMIKKYALLLCNAVTYCNIDSGDCMGLTPLLVAGHSNRHQAYDQVVKSGANLFRCPLVSTRGSKTCSIVKKGNKDFISIAYPSRQRYQFNIFQLLIQHRQFQQMVNILSQNQVYKLKKMKKGSQSINALLAQIPDCCLQLHWKTMKGLLTFKQLPKDIITIYKKQGQLRIDYHVDSLQSVKNDNASFSILIRTYSEQGEHRLHYYLIDHKNKKVHNLMKEIHAEKLKLRYEQLTQLGSLEAMYCSKFTASTKAGEASEAMDITMQTCYQNVTKAQLHSFKDVAAYERALFESEIIDYAIIQKSQAKCVTNPPKVKSKLIKSDNTLKIQWVKQKINLAHVASILALLDKKSPLFLKIDCLINVLLSEETLQPRFKNKLPIKTTLNLGNDYSIQVQIKNLSYISADEAVFGLQYRTKNMNYEEQDAGLQSLQETMIMEEGYSISMSRFLGKTEAALNFEDEESSRKFEQLLSQEIAETNQLSDEQGSAGESKQGEADDRFN